MDDDVEQDRDLDNLTNRFVRTGLWRHKDFYGIAIPLIGFFAIAFKIGDHPGQTTFGIMVGALFAIASGLACWWLFWRRR